MDIKQPATSAPHQPDQPMKSDLVPEVVEGIPVKQPNTPSGPATQVNSPGSQEQPPTSEVEMDQVLDEVSAKVKSDQPFASPKHRWLGRVFKKHPKNNVKSGPTHSNHKPLAVAILALAVGLCLMVTAYLVYKTDGDFNRSATQNQHTVRQAGVNSSVTASDIETLSVELQTIENSDGSQDFDTSALSDASLGL